MRGTDRSVIRGASFGLFLLLFATLALSSCQLSPRASVGARDHLARGDDQLAHRNFHAAINSFKAAIASTGEAEIEASALLGLGSAYAGLGYEKEAIDFLLKARRTCRGGTVGTAIEVALAEILIEKKDYASAGAHLSRAIEAAEPSDRDRLLVLAGICAHMMHDHALGERYLGEVRMNAALEALVLEHIPDYRRRAAAGWDESVARRVRPHPGRRESYGLVPVLSRRAWNASAIHPNWTPMRKPYRITVHHTGTDEPNAQSLGQAAETIKNIQSVHQKQRGWADIGYHYLIDRSGRVWEGRQLRYQGAHARGSANRGNIGIVLLGDFTRQRVTSSQANSLARFLDQVCHDYGVPRSRVYTHSEILVGQTECPGPEVTRLIRKFRSDGLASTPPVTGLRGSAPPRS